MTVRYVVVPTEATAPPIDYARFGDKTLLWSDVAERLGRGSRTAPGLLLVTQVGRCFQDEFPEVRPVLEHGRHLVISAADAPERTEDLCWKVEPLQPGVVVEIPAVQPRRIDSSVADLLARLSPASYQADVTRLAGLPTRHSLSGSFRAAMDWAAGRMTALGYATTRTSVTVGAGTSENLIGDRIGTGPAPRALVLVTAHLDSINLAGGAPAPAPGADDNASGSAGVLELGRVLSTRGWQHDVRLILFGGEEQGLFGSKQYVASLPAAERSRITAVLNMDMIACKNTAAPTVLLEGAPVSSGQMDDLAAAAATYTGLRVETSLSPFASDHVPFINAGIPAVLTIEGADSANGAIHTANDTLSRLDFALAADILRMNAAALAGWLGTTATVPRPAGSVVSWGPGRIDVFAVAPDSSLQHAYWNGSSWQDFESLGGTVLR